MPQLHPTKVLLRNHREAIVNARVDLPPFTMQGHTLNGQPQLWREDGRFMDDGRRHPLDIIHVLSPEREITHSFKS